MAWHSAFFNPLTTAKAARDQLGSIRGIYLGRDGVQRQDDLSSDTPNVLLIHGFFQTRNLWTSMETRLRQDGCGVVSFRLGGLLKRFNTRPVAELADQVSQKVERLCELHDIDGLHIIGHSKGGLIARYYIQRLGGDRRCKSLITLGTPHRGTPTAVIAKLVTGFGLVSSSANDLMPSSPLLSDLDRTPFPASVPLTSIYSREDLVSPWQRSVLPDQHKGENVQVRGIGHSQLAWDQGVYTLLRERLGLPSPSVD